MSLFHDEPSDDGLPGAERRLVMFAVMTATAMAVFDGTVVNIALPSISKALGTSTSDTVWVANGYLLAAAVTILTFSALSARIGFRALFATGVGVFTLASLGCALATSLDVLVALRVLQGIGGAATLSIGPAIYRTVFPTLLLGRVLGLNALLVAASSSIGPALGGMMVSWAGWPWLFAINVPLGIVALTLALRAIPHNPSKTIKSFDAIGAALSAVTMAAAILGTDALSNAHKQSLADVLFSCSLYGILMVGAGSAFVWRQRHTSTPLLPLDMFRSSRFSLAALTSFITFVGQGIAFLSLPILFQSAYGYDAFSAALLFSAWPIGIIIAAPQAGRLADRHPPALLSTIGLALLTIGLIALAFLPTHASAFDVVWREILSGIGFAIFQSPNNREMLSSVSKERSGNASGILAIARTFGQCLGAAIVGVALATFALNSMGEQSLATSAELEAVAIDYALGLAAIVAGLATALSATRMRARA
ncbi:MFS transporter [Pseudomonas sp. RAC1]|uniref:MFS transporter n=1 Tax=Pseudomonas sp. RAC1 TaxID=3064900 RepID=UPI0027223D28|nr:MFS transporter [Pseudomonas sp. RAC1]MDV9033406.1 MFS transporter [Pseudomonas sp. RAC1]